MPKILITGNGFDLSYNLPTSYKDFIFVVRNLKKNQSLSFESIFDCTDSSEGIKANFKHESYTTDLLEVHKLTDLRDSNLWFKFFTNELDIETWIDFENRIELVLKSIYTSVEIIKDKIFMRGALEYVDEWYGYELLNNNIVFIKILESFNIIKHKDEHIALNDDFFIKKHNFVLDIDLQKVTKFLYQELQDFQRIFLAYFEAIVTPLYKLKKKIPQRLYLTKFHYYFTFNYTSTFTKFNNITHGKVYHLHGNITKKNIVLGVNDIPEGITDEKNTLPFTKYYQKLSYNTDYRFLNEVKYNFRSNFVFVFWGHSLDSSDADYINEVFDFMTTHKAKIKKIVVAYHNLNAKNAMLVNLLSIRGKTDIMEKTRANELLFLEADSDDFIREVNKEITESPMITASVR